MASFCNLYVVTTGPRDRELEEDHMLEVRAGDVVSKPARPALHHPQDMWWLDFVRVIARPSEERFCNYT
eukprot:3774519-Amphidinium_carterae.1